MMIELNNFYNIDCMVGMKEIPNNYIDLIVTDPPYKVTSRGSSGNAGGMLKKEINKSGNVFNHNDIKPKEYLPELYRILKDGSHLYIMVNHINLQEMLNVATNNGFHFIKSLVWDKCNKIMGQFYMSQFEYILFFRKGRGNKINNCGTSDILKIPNIKSKGNNGSNLHDTEKPIELMEILIKNSSIENDIVLDPFIGIGSTMLACENLKRHYIGFELDKKYYEIACNRLERNKNQMNMFNDFDIDI